MNEKMTKARTSLVLSQPFLGTMALHLHLKEDKGQITKTMATNGKVIYFNTDFVDRINIREVEAVIAHEVLHCAFKHHSRQGDRDPKKWNYATDYAINLLLVKDGYYLPEGGLLDQQYEGMTAEQIYARLPEDESGEGDNDLTVLIGAVLPDTGENETDADGEPIEEPDWTQVMAQAATAAKLAGKMPGHYSELVDQLINPQIDWRKELRDFLTARNKDDYSWNVPNRRFIAQGIYMPSLYSETLGKIAVAVDTSGSVSNEELKAFMTELNGIREDFNMEADYAEFDHELQRELQLDPLDPMPTEVQGRGGTCFEVAMQWMGNSDATLGIVFTDGEAPEPDSYPGMPVLWVSTHAVHDWMDNQIKVAA